MAPQSYGLTMTFVLSALRESPVYKELAEKCRNCSVLFSPVPDLQFGGCGTFVRYKSLCGILTATHVMADHLEKRQIFAPLQKSENSDIFYNIPVSFLDILYLETPEGVEALKNPNVWPKGALDICLLLIDPQLFKILLLRSKKQAINLLEHKTEYLNRRQFYTASDEENTPWVWAVDGAPREGACHDNNRILQSRFDGLYVCVGSKGGTYKTDPLTLVRAPFDREADRVQHDLGLTPDPLPKNFAGISGAGMWQVAFAGAGAPETIAEMLFSNIFVAEEPQLNLSSRGPSALYDIFTAYLDLLLSEENLPRAFLP